MASLISITSPQISFAACTSVQTVVTAATTSICECRGWMGEGVERGGLLIVLRRPVINPHLSHGLKLWTWK
ncbi:hypothetical protein DFH06DRAFT_1172131 [Mycena polygramma]|nr:hypothetical protein DFH06DRAFT_1172131 [Mycena polygramma]